MLEWYGNKYVHLSDYARCRTMFKIRKGARKFIQDEYIFDIFMQPDNIMASDEYLLVNPHTGKWIVLPAVTILPLSYLFRPSTNDIIALQSAWDRGKFKLTREQDCIRVSSFDLRFSKVFHPRNMFCAANERGAFVYFPQSQSIFDECIEIKADEIPLRAIYTNGRPLNFSYNLRRTQYSQRVEWPFPITNDQVIHLHSPEVLQALAQRLDSERLSRKGRMQAEKSNRTGVQFRISDEKFGTFCTGAHFDPMNKVRSIFMVDESFVIAVPLSLKIGDSSGFDFCLFKFYQEDGDDGVEFKFEQPIRLKSLEGLSLQAVSKDWMSIFSKGMPRKWFCWYCHKPIVPGDDEECTTPGCVGYVCSCGKCLCSHPKSRFQ